MVNQSVLFITVLKPASEQLIDVAYIQFSGKKFQESTQ